jgi:hypothetical protein
VALSSLKKIATPDESSISGSNTIDMLGDMAERDLPDCYTPGEMLNVSITLFLSDPPPGVVLLEDTVPSGWVASNISNNGAFSGGKVKWSFVDGLGNYPPPSSVSYSLTPPLEATGAVSFAGILASPDESPVGGDMAILAICSQPTPTSSATPSPTLTPTPYIWERAG